MTRIFITLLLICISIFPAVSLQAKESYIVLERHSRRVLLAADSEAKRPVASLSHMVTAKVVMDWAKAAGVTSTSEITVPQHNFYNVGANPLALQAGDSLNLRDALYAALLGEDSTAATALAHHVGSDLLRRRQVEGSPIGVFVAEMNNLAKSLGMLDTRFKLPSGSDHLEKNNYSTASDIGRLSVFLAEDDGFGFYAKQKSRKLTVTKRDGEQSELVIVNSNKLLLSKLKVVGLKAGFSASAGQCMSVLADKDSYVVEKPDGGHQVTPVQLVVVVLGSSNANFLVKDLVPQGWSRYEDWRKSGSLASADRREFLKMPRTR